MKSPVQHIRLVATRHLETLLSPVPSRLDNGGATDWVVRLLVQQLYDSAPEIVRTVVGVLERICQDERTLDQVLALQPALELVGDLGSGLMTRSVTGYTLH